MKPQQYLTLQHIIQEGHKKFLKQSHFQNSNRPSHRNNFNVMRILIAFKQIFPTSPERLYKLIMTLAKKYNPQTFHQWKKALEKFQSQYQQYSLNLSKMLNTTYEERQIPYESNLLNSHQLSRNRQLSVKTYKEQLDSQIDQLSEKKSSRRRFISHFSRFKGQESAENINKHIGSTEQSRYHQNKENLINQSNKNSLRNSLQMHYVSFEPTQNIPIKQQQRKYQQETDNFMIKKQFQEKLHDNQYKNTQLRCRKQKIKPFQEISRLEGISNLSQIQPLTSKQDEKTIYGNDCSATVINQSTQSHFFNVNNFAKTYRDYPLKGLPKSQKTFTDHLTTQSSSRPTRIYKLGDNAQQNSTCLNQTKIDQITQIQDFNLTIQEWQMMNQRTKIFYEFNSKLKAFSGLLAHCQASAYQKQKRRKSQVLYNSTVAAKALQALAQNVLISLEKKRLQKKASEYRNRNLLKKGVKVLKVVNLLKNKRQSVQPNIQSFNRINYQFLMHFMFKEQLESSRRSTNSINLQLEKNAQIFSQTQSFSDVMQIYKCFGLNMEISQSKIEQFFSKYHITLCQDAFKGLKKLTFQKILLANKFKKEKAMKKSFLRWVCLIQFVKSQRLKIAKAQKLYQGKVKKKTFNRWLTFVTSTKSLSKRAQFIQKKLKIKTKQKIVRLWKYKFELKQKIKRQQEQRKQKAIKKVEIFIHKYSFRLIKKISCYIEQKANQVIQNLVFKISRKTFDHWKNLIRHKKRIQNLKKHIEIGKYSLILKKWLNYANNKSKMEKLVEILTKYLIKNTFEPVLEDAVQNYIKQKQYKYELTKNTFIQLKDTVRQRLQERGNFVYKVKNQIIRKVQLAKFFSILSYDIKLKIQLQKKAQIQKKFIQTKLWLQSSRKQSFLQALSQRTEQRFELRIKSQILLNKIKKSRLQQFFLFQFQQKTHKQKIQELHKTIIKYNFIKVKSMIRMQVLNKKHASIKEKVQNKHKISIFSVFKQQLQEKRSYIQKAQHFYHSKQKKIFFHKIISYLLQINNKNTKLNILLKLNRQKQVLQLLLTKSTKERDINNKLTQLHSIQFLKNLQRNRTQNKDIQEKKNTIQRSRKKFFYKQIFHYGNDKKINIEILRKQYYLTNRIFLNRFSRFFIQNLFDKKHLFMALKFRTIKLSHQSFRTWKNYFKNQKQKNVYTRSRQAQQQIKLLQNMRMSNN